MGTWAVPKTFGDVVLINQKIRDLNRMKDDLYCIAGDDELFDDIEGAIKRLAWLRDYSLKDWGLEPVLQSIECPVCRDLEGKKLNEVFSTDSSTDLYIHLVEKHNKNKSEAHKICKEVVR